MRTRHSSAKRGQALVMVTVALLAMCGLIGMVVDFGWSYFMRREAQAAADAAALAAGNAAMALITTSGASALSCSALSCGSETPCGVGTAGTFSNACKYAQQNGFTPGGDSGRQNVTVAGGVFSTASAPPTAPGVNARYWVTVRVSQTIPQLYSAVLGNANATISARATAAIVDFVTQGSLIALNREGDPAPTWQQSPGTFNPDLLIGSSSRINAKGGLVLSSNDAGAGTNLGSISAISPFTMTRGGLSPAGNWNSAGPSTGQADGPQFLDPYRGMGQPPVTSSPLTAYPVPGGVLNGTTVPACATACPPGYYFATSAGVPTGAPITISSNLNFANGGSFGDYVFYGGLSIASATVNLDPGRYVLAGTASASTPDLSIGSGAAVTGGAGTDAGRLFILTQPDYPGLSTIAPLPSGMPSLAFAPSILDPGTGNVTLYGLNNAQTLPTETNPLGYALTDFGNVLMWQDQRFSNIANPSNTTPHLTMGSTTMMLDGVIYQPRGAWTKVKPSAIVQGISPSSQPGGLRIVTGALDMGGARSSILFCGSSCNAPEPFWNRTVALVE